MKKILLLLLLCAFCYIPAYAHPGKTDEQGGHYNNETGEYHYHHGYPAHEHVNGECPYDFDDQTGVNSGTSSVSTVTPKPELHLETPDPLSPTLKPKQSLADPPRTLALTLTRGDLTVSPVPSSPPSNKKHINMPLFNAIPAIMSVILIAVIIILSAVHKKNRTRASKNHAEELKILKQTYEGEISELKEQLEREKRKPRVPDGYALDENFLPYKLNRVYYWGKEFNAYVTQKGHCYHRHYCKALKGKGKVDTVIHRYDAIKQGYDACHYCIPKDKIDDWYINLFPNSPYSNLNNSPAASETGKIHN